MSIVYTTVFSTFCQGTPVFINPFENNCSQLNFCKQNARAVSLDISVMDYILLIDKSFFLLLYQVITGLSSLFKDYHWPIFLYDEQQHIISKL